MHGLFSSIYLGSKVVSAILNVVSIAIFTRLASEQVFGEYLIGFAFGFIGYSLAVQWLLGAHFGQQSRQHAGRIAGAAVVMTAMSMAVGLVLILVAALFHVVPPELAVECAVLLIGLSFYFIANEIGRSQLLVAAVTGAAFLRSLFTFLFGCFALWQFHSASALLIAISIGHVLSVLPIALALRRSIWSEGFKWPVRADYAQLWHYGWPLILAGGASAVAVSIDRILLDRFHGATEVAPYGVTLDFIKQSFIIVGETVAVSYVSLAKSFHGDGLDGKAAEGLKKAFVTIGYLATFGVVFFLLLGEPLFGVLLGDGYFEAMPLIPWMAVASACLILRAYYFAQVIYFTSSVRMELVSTGVALVVGVTAGLLLIPTYAMAGAAIAFTLAQVAALLTFFASPDTRRLMPLDVPRLGIVLAAGAGTVVIGEIAVVLFPAAVSAAFNLVLITLVSGTLLVRWDMFDAGKIWSRLGRTMGRLRTDPPA